MVPRQYVESVIYGQSNSQRFIVNDQCSGNYKTIVKETNISCLRSEAEARAVY